MRSQPLTSKQIEARKRNWKIRTLRCMYVQTGDVIQDWQRREQMHILIDKELETLGAETEFARAAKRRQQVQKET